MQITEFYVDSFYAQNRFYPILTSISTVTMLALAILVLHNMMTKEIFGYVGIGFSTLLLINAFLHPKVKQDPRTIYHFRTTQFRDSGDNFETTQTVKKIYATIAFIIMVILYALMLWDKIPSYDMAVVSLTSTSLTLSSLISLGRYCDNDHKKDEEFCAAHHFPFDQFES